MGLTQRRVDICEQVFWFGALRAVEVNLEAGNAGQFTSTARQPLSQEGNIGITEFAVRTMVSGHGVFTTGNGLYTGIASAAKILVHGNAGVVAQFGRGCDLRIIVADAYAHGVAAQTSIFSQNGQQLVPGCANLWIRPNMAHEGHTQWLHFLDLDFHISSSTECPESCDTMLLSVMQAGGDLRQLPAP